MRNPPAELICKCSELDRRPSNGSLKLHDHPSEQGGGRLVGIGTASLPHPDPQADQVLYEHSKVAVRFNQFFGLQVAPCEECPAKRHGAWRFRRNQLLDLVPNLLPTTNSLFFPLTA
ncbi:MAG: hypothetical protein ACLQKA_24620 [Bryobacteraceae bacterium]